LGPAGLAATAGVIAAPPVGDLALRRSQYRHAHAPKNSAFSVNIRAVAGLIWGMDGTEADNNGHGIGSNLPQNARRRSPNNGRPPRRLSVNPAAANQKTVKPSRMKRRELGDIQQNMTATLRRMVAEPPDKQVRPQTKLDVMLRKLVDAAMSGTQYAMQEVFDRLGGKPGRAAAVVEARPGADDHIHKQMALIEKGDGGYEFDILALEAEAEAAKMGNQ
jgi:hypothetical protein